MLSLRVYYIVKETNGNVLISDNLLDWYDYREPECKSYPTKLRPNILALIHSVTVRHEYITQNGYSKLDFYLNKEDFIYLYNEANRQ